MTAAGSSNGERRQSPFKFLDAYQKEDAAQFFGRDRETAQLYNAVHASNLVLVYGASGTGKTSLINCGLANKFLDSDWLPVHIRRGNGINASFDQEIAAAMIAAPRAEDTIVDRIRSLYLDRYRPLYFIFDQFEELFILGTPDEQERFYDTVKALLGGRTSCKILIVIREDYIAHLSGFERAVPWLLDTRLRVEAMSDGNLCDVIVGTATAGGIAMADPTGTAMEILDNIRDTHAGVDLVSLQVYLDRLWRKAAERRAADASPLVFDRELVRSVGQFKHVLGDFLDEQLGHLEATLSANGAPRPAGLPLEVLYALVTDEGTRRSLALASLLERLPDNLGVAQAHVETCLEEFTRMRLVRSLAGDPTAEEAAPGQDRG